MFSLRDDPAGLWTAEQDGEIVGSAFSWICGDLWFLAELFIAPERQGEGIGNELLRRAPGHAPKAGAPHTAPLTFPFNPGSHAPSIPPPHFPPPPPPLSPRSPP